MTENEIIGGAANALTEKPKFVITIPITVLPEPEPIPKRTLLDRLSRKPLPIPKHVEKERTLVFYPCKVANIHRIAAKSLELPDEALINDVRADLLPLLADQKNLGNIIYIIAAAIQNNHMEPSEELQSFLLLNMDHEDMFLCLHYALGNSGMKSFLNSIVLVRGLITILKPEASPLDGSE